MAMLFASHHPERVEKVVVMSAGAPASADEAVRRESGERFIEPDVVVGTMMHIAETWGEDAEPFTEVFAPSRIDDPAYLRWANRLNRLSASPNDFVAQLMSVMEIDGRADPGAVTAPTLVVHVKGDRVRPIGHGRVLAEALPNSQLLEVDGDDHIIYSLDNWRDALDPAIEFFTGTRRLRRRTAVSESCCLPTSSAPPPPHPPWETPATPNSSTGTTASATTVSAPVAAES